MCARRQLLAGKAAQPVRQFMPHFTSPGTRDAGAQCAFVSLEVTACGVLDEEVRMAALGGQGPLGRHACRQDQHTCMCAGRTAAV